MLYFANTCSNKLILAEMYAGTIGAIATPRQGNNINGVQAWCADSGCFTDGYPGDIEYLCWLASKRYMADGCRFATAPDVMMDARATLSRAAPFLPVIRALGYPAALVGQDGLESLTVPWDSLDAYFIGGSTEWKLGEAAAGLAREAKRRGKWVHMGRVNSYKRLAYASSIGCDSADGTFLRFSPGENIGRMFRWFEKLEAASALSRGTY